MARGQLLDGDPSFVTTTRHSWRTSTWTNEVVYAGSEPALIQAFRQADANRDWVTGYFYEPQ